MDADDGHGRVVEGRLLSGRYRLGARLGRGGAASVYEAVDTVLGRRVAVKLYQAADPRGRYRFASEARLLAGLSHPGLVTVHDVRLDDDQPFLVLQLVDGPTLRDLMDAGPLAPDAVARIGEQLAGALAHVHARDMVHRDIKPSNVLIAPSGDCLLTDFGLARMLNAMHLTVPGEYVGTAAYLAPEQITDVDVGPPADIYALGLVLLECLTGRTEYIGSTAETALARLSRSPRVPRNLPAPWRTLLADMTARDPAHRPSAAFCAELLAAPGEERPDTHLAELPVPLPRASRRPRLVRAGLAAVAIAAAATAAVVTTTDPESSGRPPALAPETPRTEPAPSTPSTPPSTPPSVPAPPAAAAPASAPATQQPEPGTIPPGPPVTRPRQFPGPPVSGGPGPGRGPGTVPGPIHRQG